MDWTLVGRKRTFGCEKMALQAVDDGETENDDLQLMMLCNDFRLMKLCNDFRLVRMLCSDFPLMRLLCNDLRLML